MAPIEWVLLQITLYESSTLIILRKCELPWQIGQIPRTSTQYKIMKHDEWRKAQAIDVPNAVPIPSAGVDRGSRSGRVSSAASGRTSTAVSDFKKSRVSKRERMSTNYIW